MMPMGSSQRHLDLVMALLGHLQILVVRNVRAHACVADLTRTYHGLSWHGTLRKESSNIRDVVTKYGCLWTI